jgi:hypothetical protein
VRQPPVTSVTTRCACVTISFVLLAIPLVADPLKVAPRTRCNIVCAVPAVREADQAFRVRVELHLDPVQPAIDARLLAEADRVIVVRVLKRTTILPGALQVIRPVKRSVYSSLAMRWVVATNA